MLGRTFVPMGGFRRGELPLISAYATPKPDPELHELFNKMRQFTAERNIVFFTPKAPPYHVNGVVDMLIGSDAMYRFLRNDPIVPRFLVVRRGKQRPQSVGPAVLSLKHMAADDQWFR